MLINRICEVRTQDVLLDFPEAFFESICQTGRFVCRSHHPHGEHPSPAKFLCLGIMNLKCGVFQSPGELFIPSAMLLSMLPPEERCTQRTITGGFYEKIRIRLTGQVNSPVMVVGIKSLTRDTIKPEERFGAR